GGGAAVQKAVAERWQKITGVPLCEGYGLTECSPTVTCNPLHITAYTGSIGLPMPSTDVAIRDEDGTEVPIGAPGELCVRGPQVMKEYWHKPEETALVLRQGLLHTGDVATMDEGGYVRIVDRIKDMIIVNGFKVYPRNVEDIIYGFAGVGECVVAGVPDPARGEVVKAWIYPKAGAHIEVEALRVYLKHELQPVEVPKQIEITDAPLPKTLVGKLSRKELVAREAAKIPVSTKAER
ncbi:MAG: AMP-binding protein, partial [Alphaproteobacteria bacterium]|nr:AMP-binding protein [Alphaproteobacteria bacterium]